MRGKCARRHSLPRLRGEDVLAAACVLVRPRHAPEVVADLQDRGPQLVVAVAVAAARTQHPHACAHRRSFARERGRPDSGKSAEAIKRALRAHTPLWALAYIRAPRPAEHSMQSHRRLGSARRQRPAALGDAVKNGVANFFPSQRRSALDDDAVGLVNGWQVREAQRVVPAATKPATDGGLRRPARPRALAAQAHEDARAELNVVCGAAARLHVLTHQEVVRLVHGRDRTRAANTFRAFANFGHAQAFLKPAQERMLHALVKRE